MNKRAGQELLFPQCMSAITCYLKLCFSLEMNKYGECSESSRSVFLFIIFEVLEFQNSTGYFSAEGLLGQRVNISGKAKDEAQMKLKEFIFRCWDVLNNNE